MNFKIRKIVVEQTLKQYCAFIFRFWPCACIPCCIDSLNSVTHKCPQCKNFLGRYKGGM